MNLILRIIITGALLLLFACKSVYKADPFPEPERESGQTDVLALRAEPLDTVRVAFIGVGARGMAAVKRFMNIEGVRVVALCVVRCRFFQGCQSAEDSGCEGTRTGRGILWPR